MTEDYLHYLWKTKQFDHNNLTTTKGETIQINSYGFHNQNAGPDFSNASISIDGTEWYGHVEIHKKSSDWFRHNHQSDNAYQNVILHVVYEHDKDVLYPSGKVVPVLVLKNRVDYSLYQQYEKLLKRNKSIPCETRLGIVDDFIKTSQYDKLVIERLERKSKWIKRDLDLLQDDWNEVLFYTLAYSFGLKVNAESFLDLARLLPLKVLLKNKDIFVVEALLFGCAGFLEEAKDDYQIALQKEFKFQKQKFNLHTLSSSQFKFSKIQPKGFPTVRLAQLASFIANSMVDFDQWVTKLNLKGIQEKFEIETSAYWNNHYTFGNHSKKIKKTIGKNVVTRFIINGLAPLILVYGQKKNHPEVKTQVIELLEQIPNEKNSILMEMEVCGFTNKNALSSQALLELKQNYCAHKKCLNCAIGNYLLNKSW